MGGVGLSGLSFQEISIRGDAEQKAQERRGREAQRDSSQRTRGATRIWEMQGMVLPWSFPRMYNPPNT